LDTLAALEGFAEALVSLFIVIDPIGNIPLFLTLTKDMDSGERRRVFRTAVLTSIALLLILALLGRQILLFFNISLGEFMIAGGILLMIIAVKILLGGWREEGPPESVGAVPLACPLIVGPGAVTTTIVLIGTVGFVNTLLAVVVNLSLVWLVLRFIEPINRFLGRAGSEVIARVMAILIASIAVGYVFRGLSTLEKTGFF